MKRRAVTVMLALGLAAGCATPSTVGQGGSTRIYPADWELAAESPTSRTISGYVYNEYGRHARDVRVMVEALDAEQNVVDRRLAWVLGGVPANNRTSFEVRGVPVAAAYRVSVPYWTWQEQGPGGFFGVRF